jgi:hypothetical protein
VSKERQLANNIIQVQNFCGHIKWLVTEIASIWVT